MGSSDFFINFLMSFELRLVAGLFLFCTKMEKRSYFYLRVLVFVPLLLISPILAVCGINITMVLMVGWFSFQFPIELIVGLACVVFCFDIDWKRLLYVGAGAYTYQNMVNALTFSLVMRFRWYNTVWHYLIYSVAVVVFWLALYFFVLKQKWFITSTRMPALPLIFSIALSLGILLVYSSYLTFGVYGGAEIHQNQFIISTLILALLLSIIRNNSRVVEKEILQRLLLAKEKEYRINQETIELINQKSHDLKKILAYIKANAEGPMLEEANSIEESIKKYDSIVQTGLGTVDIVLSEKKIYCTAHDINFSCMVDGALLRRMSEVDVYTLLTNAIDNAIEATEPIEDPSKRNITLNVSRVGEMVRFKIENTFAVAPKFVSGMPITNKSNKKYHGFGLQSIKATVKKYDGFFDCFVSQGKFVLLATFPYEG